MTRTISIAAGGSYTERITAKVFVCLKTGSNSVTVKPDSGTAEPLYSGVGFGSSSSDVFHRLEFSNPTTAAIIVTFYAGNEDFRCFAPLKKELQVTGQMRVVPSLGGIIFTGIEPATPSNRNISAGARRNLVRFQNLDAATTLFGQVFWTKVSTWVTAFSILPLSALTIEGSYDLQLVNESGADVNVFVFEDFEL